jgi:hypothetical protein
MIMTTPMHRYCAQGHTLKIEANSPGKATHQECLCRKRACAATPSSSSVQPPPTALHCSTERPHRCPLIIMLPCDAIAASDSALASPNSSQSSQCTIRRAAPTGYASLSNPAQQSSPSVSTAAPNPVRDTVMMPGQHPHTPSSPVKTSTQFLPAQLAARCCFT